MALGIRAKQINIKLRKTTVSHIFVFFKVHKMKLNYLYMSLRVSNVDHVRFKLPTTFIFCTRVFQEKLDVAKNHLHILSI